MAESDQVLDQMVEDPATLAGIWHDIVGIRRRLPGVAGFRHRRVSESSNSQLLERKSRLRCLKESRLRLLSTKNNLRF
jgi:hypothetical protein